MIATQTEDYACGQSFKRTIRSPCLYSREQGDWPPEDYKIKEVVIITRVLDEDPPCLVVGGYTRHHISDEPHGLNLLALKFEMSH